MTRRIFLVSLNLIVIKNFGLDDQDGFSCAMVILASQIYYKDSNKTQLPGQFDALTASRVVSIKSRDVVYIRFICSIFDFIFLIVFINLWFSVVTGFSGSRQVVRDPT